MRDEIAQMHEDTRHRTKALKETIKSFFEKEESM